MIDQNMFRPPSLSPDRRHLLVNELWESITSTLEEIDLDTAQKNELILDLGRYHASRADGDGVSLRALSADGVRNALSLDGGPA